jgi:hypothetical protein
MVKYAQKMGNKRLKKKIEDLNKQIIQPSYERS